MKQHRIYGLTENEHTALVTRADGRCECCGEARPLGIDHCHSTGHVRGLLCTTCNSRLGRHENGTINDPLCADYLLRIKADKGSGRYHVTPVRKVRVPDELWRRALARAEEEGTSVSAVIVRALEEWVERRGSGEGDERES